MHDDRAIALLIANYVTTRLITPANGELKLVYTTLKRIVQADF